MFYEIILKFFEGYIRHFVLASAPQTNLTLHHHQVLGTNFLTILTVSYSQLPCPMDLDTHNQSNPVPLLDHLTPLNNHQQVPPQVSLSHPLNPLSLLERLNERPSSRNSIHSYSNTMNRRSQNHKRSLAYSDHSTETLPSLVLKRKRLSTSTLTNSTPFDMTMCPTRPNPSPETCKTMETSITQSMNSSRKSHIVQDRGKNPLTQVSLKNLPASEKRLRNQKCLGTNLGKHLILPRTPVVEKPVDCCELSTGISLVANSGLNSLNVHPPVFPHLNGNASSEENPLNSIISSPLSTALQLMKRERLALEMQRSAWVSLMQNGVSVPLPSGLQHGILLPDLSVLSSPTVRQNYMRTVTTSKVNLPPKSRVHMRRSSSSTSLSATSFKEDNLFSSQTNNISSDSTLQSSCRTESNTVPGRALIGDPISHVLPEAKLTSAIGSTLPVAAHPPTLNADIATSAKAAKRGDTEKTNARSELYRRALGFRPKYLRYNLWSSSPQLTPTIADWSETAIPLPRPPLSELSNPIVSQTISENLSLFKIITPIDVNRFEDLLSDHPNQPFVCSICSGLREGFWPWADTLKEGYPVIHDGSRTPTETKKAKFICDQRDIEIGKGRFSTSFGTDLLPGMYSMPVHAVPKPGSTDLRMVTDHSAGIYSLNSMINHELVTGYPLDNMTHIGKMLLSFRRNTPNDRKLVMWKSDIAEAYRLIPVHSFWQIKQINTVNGQCYVDRNNAFGSSASGAIFIAFNSLVLWIARRKWD